MILVIDCCIRGEESATRRYYQEYLKLAGEDYTVLELATLPLLPIDKTALALRDAFCSQQRYDDEMFALAKQFRAADEILVAAPFWDLSFPSLLKVYFEHIMVNGLTFGYDKDGRCCGYCKAKRLLYFSTCGGYVGEQHLGFAYIKALAAMLGIEESVPYILEGMDIDLSKRDMLLKQAIASLANTKIGE